MPTARGILLPRVKTIELHGFLPLFEAPIILSLPPGPFLILGGNGLGKTTMLQAVVYGLAGIADDAIEDEKRFRWNIQYFKKRLVPGADAEIVVQFSLGNHDITIRRGIKTDRLRAVRFGAQPWINDSGSATEEYENTVTKIGRYPSFEDFRYLTHKLCYLAEHRRSLVWDQRAQLRVLMLICGDPGREAEYYNARQELTSANTDMRHRHVDITHLEARILRAEQAQRKSKDAARPRPSPRPDTNIKRIGELQTSIAELSNKRREVLENLRTQRASLLSSNTALEGLQKRLSQSEDIFVLGILRDTEVAETALGLHKLLVHHRCPYCTQVSEELASEAKTRVEEGLCPICGQSHVTQVPSAEVLALRETVLSRSQERDASESQILKFENTLSLITEEEMATRTELDALAESLPRVPKDEDLQFSTTDLAGLRRTLNRYEREHARLAVRCEQIRRRLDAKYEDFRESCARNLRDLQHLASEYGEAFLGDPCEFIQIQAPGELHNFSFFVPKFAAEERIEPEECSESERFFLDIAFRMAVIELAGKLSDESATFICETPENALDLAYTDNVAAMFRKFSTKSFGLLLTANLQFGGVAFPLLQHYRPAQRKRHVFSLINEVPLTKVQKKRENDFKKELRKILEHQ